MMHVSPATDPAAWDAFLASQRYAPFLQSWTMGDVYNDIGQTPVRLQVTQDSKIVGICFAHLVPARRGRHLSVPYGPVFAESLRPEDFTAIAAPLIAALKQAAKEHSCAFLRLSPFLRDIDQKAFENMCTSAGARVRPSPLHLLAEHVWYLPLTTPDSWDHATGKTALTPRDPDEIFKNFRATTRNLVRRAEKDGVTIRASSDPVRDTDEHFIRLHDETRKRHAFTPYSNTFFRSQVRRFAARKECTVYLAEYQNQVIAASIHMHACGETSYHHGASADAFKKIPSSYLLQWTAIRDALVRGDRVYNFWGIAPTTEQDGTVRPQKDHPFAGVTLFKTGFGGSLMPLMHCVDIPLSTLYYITRGFEYLRKWKRGF